MEYYTKLGIDGHGEAPNDAAQDVAEYIHDLLGRAVEHDRHLSMLIGTLLSPETTKRFKENLRCDVLGLLTAHMEKISNTSTVRILVWGGVGLSELKFADGYIDLMRKYSSRFQIRASTTSRLSDQLSHFALASPVINAASTVRDNFWGLRIERPHAQDEQQNFAAWNSFAFDNSQENSEYLAVRDGPRLLGFFNSIWAKAGSIEPPYQRMAG